MGKEGRFSSKLSEVFRRAQGQEFIWDEASLNAWLTDPQVFVPGTYMTFRGIDDEKVRGDLIAFLKIAMAPGGAKSVAAQGLIGADMARGQAPEPLAAAGPEEQVTRIRHCQNTFFVATADGRQRPFWEMNLRLKIDSSSNGPKGGKPVLVSGGMQGTGRRSCSRISRKSGVWSNESAEVGSAVPRRK